MAVTSMANSSIENFRKFRNMSTTLPRPTISGGDSVSTYTVGGVQWTAHIFTTSGNLTVSTPNALLDTLCVGGGGGMGNRYSREGRGGGGAVRFGYQEYVETGDYAIIIGGNTTIHDPSLNLFLGSGAGMGGFANENDGSYGANGLGGGGSPGGVSKNSGVRNGGGAGGSVYGASNTDGIDLQYEGSTLSYSRGGNGTSNTTAGWGAGSGGSLWSQGGRAGIVVVRYKS